VPTSGEGEAKDHYSSRQEVEWHVTLSGPEVTTKPRPLLYRPAHHETEHHQQIWSDKASHGQMCCHRTSNQ